MPENVAIALLNNCTAPWRSLDAHHRQQSAEAFHTDSPDQMQRCFHCTKSECDNCLRNNYSRKRIDRKESVKEIFCKYFYAGLSRTMICSKMNISKMTYYRYRKQFITLKEG